MMKHYVGSLLYVLKLRDNGCQLKEIQGYILCTILMVMGKDRWGK